MRPRLRFLARRSPAAPCKHRLAMELLTVVAERLTRKNAVCFSGTLFVGFETLPQFADMSCQFGWHLVGSAVRAALGLAAAKCVLMSVSDPCVSSGYELVGHERTVRH